MDFSNILVLFALLLPPFCINFLIRSPIKPLSPFLSPLPHITSSVLFPQGLLVLTLKKMFVFENEFQMYLGCP